MIFIHEISNAKYSSLWFLGAIADLHQANLSQAALETNTVQLSITVGWVERSVTQQNLLNVGFRSSTQPTQFQVCGTN